MSDKTCLITGVSGFVGGYLAKAALDEGGFACVHGTCFGDAENVMPGLPIELHELDILDRAGAEALISTLKPAVILHLAALSSPALSFQKPELTFDINVKGALNVLEAVRAHAPEARVVLVGSSDQYGDTPLPENGAVLESLPFRPATPYAASKAAQDSLGRIYAKAYGLNIIMTRSFNHAGPRQGDAFVLSSFARQIADIEYGRAEPVLYVGNLDARRDFSDVRDVVRAYVALADRGAPGEAYNVGSGKAYEIRSLLGMLLSLSSARIEVRSDPARMRPSDTPLLVCDNAKLVAATGWKPEIAIEQTLEDILNYWRGKASKKSAAL